MEIRVVDRTSDEANTAIVSDGDEYIEIQGPQPSLVRGKHDKGKIADRRGVGSGAVVSIAFDGLKSDKWTVSV